MKNLLFSVVFCLAFLFLPRSSRAQIELIVDTIDSIPNPAVEGVPYLLSFHIARVDTGSATFNGNLFVLIQSQSTQVTDTMAFFPLLVLGQFQDTTVTDTFTFESASFDGGDNIVVVWPASSQFIIPDTMQTHINFSSVGIDENEKMPIVSLYPNPATRFLNLHYTDPEKVEQVRVLDILGKEQCVFIQAVNSLDTRPFASGIYFIEVRLKNGIRAVQRFVVE